MSTRILVRSWRFWLLFIVIAFAMQVGVKYIWENDENLESSRSWLMAHDELISKVGAIGSIQVTKSISFRGDATTSPYNDYTMLVLGEEARAVVIVRAFTGEGRPEKFELVSVKMI